MLKVGERAPDFEVEATNGERLRLSDLRGSYVALFFFPKAFTPGCSVETKQFAEAAPDLEELGVRVVGVSTDDHETQCDFAKSMGATFPMIGDHELRVSKAFGVLWPLLKKVRRVTYVIDPDGIIRGVFHHEIQVKKHLADVRALMENRTV